MSIMDKLKKNSKVKTSEVLADSKFFNEKDIGDRWQRFYWFKNS